MGGSGRDLFRAEYKHLDGITEENHEYLNLAGLWAEIRMGISGLQSRDLNYYTERLWYIM
jgi:hypothetical protein